MSFEHGATNGRGYLTWVLAGCSTFSPMIITSILTSRTLCYHNRDFSTWYPTTVQQSTHIQTYYLHCTCPVYTLVAKFVFGEMDGPQGQRSAGWTAARSLEPGWSPVELNAELNQMQSDAKVDVNSNLQ